MAGPPSEGRPPSASSGTTDWIRSAIPFLRSFSGSSAKVFLALAVHANGDARKGVFPSASRIAEMTGLSQRSVVRCLRNLESIGLLDREDRPGRSSVYRLKSRNPAREAIFSTETTRTPSETANGRPTPESAPISASSSKVRRRKSTSPSKSSGRTTGKRRSPRTAKTTSDSKRKSKSSGPPWTVEAAKIWSDATGGTAPFGRIGKALKPLIERHGTIPVFQAFERYLRSTDIQFASPERFASTFGRWSSERTTTGSRKTVRDDDPRIVSPRTIEDLVYATLAYGGAIYSGDDLDVLRRRGMTLRDAVKKTAGEDTWMEIEKVIERERKNGLPEGNLK